MTLENSRTTTLTSATHARAATVSMPVGPVRLMARYQNRSGGTDMQSAWIGTQSRDLLASAAYFAGPNVNFNYQVATNWQDGMSNNMWKQLIGTYRLSSRTQLQSVSGFPQIFEPDLLRLRLTQDMGNRYSAIIDYGRLSPFQGVGAAPGQRGFMFMVQRRWELDTPARGGRINGRVTDILGRPMSKAAVRLSNFRAVTDERGRYAFRDVPKGGYEISLDNDSLPADFTAREEPRRMAISNRSRETVNFTVVPLNSILGRVVVDGENPSTDKPEGAEGAALRLGTQATVTDRDGTFGFYNVEPGKLTVALDTSRLSGDWEAASPTTQTVEVLPDKTTSGLVFHIRRREKPVVFVEMKP